MKRLILLAGLLASMQVAGAQSLSGGVMNDKGEPLSPATVVLLNPADSTLEFFGITDEKGRFEVKSIKNGNYLMQVAFLGYQSYYKSLAFPYNLTNDYGLVVLKPKQVDIGEVRVVGEYVPLTIRHDTIEFNARAFKTKSDASVEELLKKLPGVEVDRAGNIKALGKDVRKVLVDGKEFFGNDPKVATKNLPAEAIDKVQVYDKRSDEAEFTGIDDGTRDKTVNLVLKEDKKKGIMGDVSAGAGTGKHYAGNGKVYRFTDKIQAAALGMVNNVNQSGFSFGDYMSFNGGFSSMSGGGAMMIGGNDGFPVNFGEPEKGLMSAGAGGANFSYSWGKESRVFASYIFNGTHRRMEEKSTTRNYTADGSFTEKQQAGQIQRDTSHRINFGLKARADSTQSFILNGNFGFSAGFSPQNSLTHTYRNDLPVFDLERTSEGRSESVSGNVRGSWLKKFNRNRSVLKLSADGSWSASLSNLLYRNTTTFFAPAGIQVASQFQDAETDNQTYSGNLALTQKIKGLVFIEPTFSFGYGNEHYNRKQGIPVEDDRLVDSLFSPDFRKGYRWLRPGVSLTRNSDKTQFTAALSMETGEVRSTLWNDLPVSKQHMYLLPRLQWEWEYRTGRRVMLFYQSDVNTPSASQLLPVVENSNPMYLSFGNRNLRPEYSHNLYLNWLIFDQFSFTSLMTGIDAGYTADKINWSRSVGEDLRQTLTLVNVRNDYRASARADFSTPIRKLGVKINLNVREGFNRGLNLVNGTENVNTNLTHKVSLTVDNRKKDKWDVMAGGSLQMTDARYSIQESLNNRYFDLSGFTEIRFTPSDKWNFAFKADVTNYTAKSFEKPVLIPLLSGEISYYFLKFNRGVLTLQGVDLLDRNTGIQRVSQMNYLQERISNMLGRYVMLTFKYRLNKVGGNGGSHFDVKIAR